MASVEAASGAHVGWARIDRSAPVPGWRWGYWLAIALWLGVVWPQAGAQTATLTSVTTSIPATAGQLTLIAGIDYSTKPAPTALGFTITLPTGWTMVSVGGPNQPSVAPDPGTAGLLEFAYVSFPSNSASFSVVVAYPAGLSGNQTITAEGIYRTPLTKPSVTPLVIAGPAAPLTITTQPASQTLIAGQPLTLSVVTAGGTSPTFQWRKGGVAITGATSSSYRIDAVQTSNAGSYDVVVVSGAASLTSTSATVAVTPQAIAPSVTAQPVSVSTAAGTAASFSVTASGTAPLSYQWKKNGTIISGATSANWSINPVNSGDAGTYEVTVSNAAGSATSSAATLTVLLPPTITVQPQAITVTQGEAATLSVLATGTAPFSYQWRKNGNAIAGATASSYSISAVVAADAASYSVVVTNAVGSATSALAALTVVASPAITTQPQSVTVTPGAAASFSVVATGAAPLSYQWRKNGTNLVGATSTSFAIASVVAVDAGSYSVVVTNAAGSVTSAVATLTVTAAVTVPAITVQPGSVTVNQGASAALSVTASGTGPLTYQWRKDGVSIAGATGASYAATQAGSYTVVVGNSAGSVTSEAAVVTVRAVTYAGTYFGAFGADGGSFALYVRSDRTGVFLGYAKATQAALVSRDVVVDAAGAFQATLPAGALPAGQPGEPARAAADASYTLTGRIGSDGALTGTVSGLNLTLSATAAASGATASLSGYYQAGAAGSGATSYAIIGAAGEAYVVTVNGGVADAGRGTVSSTGVVTVTTQASTSVTGNVGGSAVSLTASTGGTTVTYVGANADTRTDDEKLFNLSSRSQTGVGGQVLIAGFVISGSEPKPVLIRAIGPTLGAFGLSGALSAARLDLSNGVSGLNWGSAANADQVAAATTKVGAFPLDRASRDAAVLVTLAPGAYTAMVTGQGGASGVCLVEVYDASEGTASKAQRLVNISSRALVGTGESALIGGFVITGAVPKRVLIRGVGPGLAQFGVPSVLSKPQLTLTQNGRVVAQNAGFGGTPEATAIAAAAASVGAFPLTATAGDAALLINLEPGAYTAQVTGAGGLVGNALVEIYEVP